MIVPRSPQKHTRRGPVRRGLLRSFPIIVLMTLMVSVLMAVPMLHAVWIEDWRVARAFFYHGVFWAVIAAMVGLALANRPPRSYIVRPLVILLSCYAVLPAVMATPVEYLVPSITYSQAYFEMLSSLTTTGATIFADPAAIPEPVHLWRALTGWTGGFIILVAAIAVLEPLQLGGFEIQSSVSQRAAQQVRAAGGRSEARQRLLHSARQIAPIYAGLTLLLAALLAVAGDRALVAFSHAFSVMSTSGITPLSSFGQAASGRVGEVIIFVFLLVEISRHSLRLFSGHNILRDPEYQLALTVILGLTVLLFLRHFLAAIEVSGQQDLAAAAIAFWGGLFNILSYISTTGFNSADWENARNWSGLETPGLILLLLSMMGGGIATTCGGVKLLRVYALYKHGMREMRRLIHPNSVGGAGMTARRIRREGAQIAWIFLMLFLFGFGLCLLAFTALGQSFESALALSTAALTNTGPAAQQMAPDMVYAGLTAAEKLVFSLAMVFGRVEALVFVSLLNPAYWRD